MLCSFMYTPTEVTWKTCEQTEHSYVLPLSRWNHVKIMLILNNTIEVKISSSLKG